MTRYRLRTHEVEAVQWEYDGKGGPYGPVPPGFTLSPPPTDFGVPRSCWNPALRVMLHPGDWLVRSWEQTPTGLVERYARMDGAEFARRYEPIASHS